MLMRTDPFREFDRPAQQMTGAAQGTWSRPTPMPMDAYRERDTFTVCFDLPGADPAKYASGVPTLRIPVAESAKPRRITIGNADDEHTGVESTTSDRT